MLFQCLKSLAYHTHRSQHALAIPAQPACWWCGTEPASSGHDHHVRFRLEPTGVWSPLSTVNSLCVCASACVCPLAKQKQHSRMMEHLCAYWCHSDFLCAQRASHKDNCCLLCRRTSRPKHVRTASDRRTRCVLVCALQVLMRALCLSRSLSLSLSLSFVLFPSPSPSLSLYSHTLPVCMHTQVLVLRLMTEGSVEGHIIQVAEEKKRFADSSITGDQGKRLCCGGFHFLLQITMKKWQSCSSAG